MYLYQLNIILDGSEGKKNEIEDNHILRKWIDRLNLRNFRISNKLKFDVETVKQDSFVEFIKSLKNINKYKCRYIYYKNSLFENLYDFISLLMERDCSSIDFVKTFSLLIIDFLLTLDLFCSFLCWITFIFVA